MYLFMHVCSHIQLFTIIAIVPHADSSFSTYLLIHSHVKIWVLSPINVNVFTCSDIHTRFNRAPHLYTQMCNSMALLIINELRKNFMHYPRHSLLFRGPRTRLGSIICGVYSHTISLVYRLESKVLSNYYTQFKHFDTFN